MGEKTYRARTMKEALAQVRRDLGGDAMILASREVRRRRLFGLGPRELIEVKASATMPSDQATLFREAAGKNPRGRQPVRRSPPDLRPSSESSSAACTRWSKL